MRRSGEIWVLTATGFPLEIEVSDHDYLNLYDLFRQRTAGDKVNFMAIPLPALNRVQHCHHVRVDRG